MTLTLVIGGSMVLGMLLAELWHRRDLRAYKRAQLIAEYMDRQLWQFISLDEWLAKEAHPNG